MVEQSEIVLNGLVASRTKRLPKDDGEDVPSIGDALDLAPSGLDAHVGFMLRIAMGAVLRDLALALKKFELRLSQYACLLVVQAEPGLKQQRIGEILSVKHSNLVAIITQLESFGYVDRARPNRDRRSNIVYLTNAGAKVLTQIAPVVAAHNGRLVAAVGKRDLKILLGSLNRLARLG